MIDDAGNVWLIECNCPPCTTTATGLPEAEALHHNIAKGIIELLVLPSVRKSRDSDTSMSAIKCGPNCDGKHESHNDGDRNGGFVCCRKGREDFVPSPQVKLAFNAFAWSKFVRSQRNMT